MERKADIEVTVSYADKAGRLHVKTLRIHDGATIAGILATVNTLYAPAEIFGLQMAAAE